MDKILSYGSTPHSSPLHHSFAPASEASRAFESVLMSILRWPKCGRPPKMTLPISSSLDIHNHRCLSHPPGLGPKQRPKAKLLASGQNISPKKRPVGRPCKGNNMGGRVKIKMIQGKIVSYPTFQCFFNQLIWFAVSAQ